MAKGDKKRVLRGRAGRMQGGRGSGRAGAGQVRLWGRHAVEAALLNPDRQHRKLWATREGIASLNGDLPPDFPVEYADTPDLDRLVARDAPHQGLVLECAPLEDIHLDEVLTGDPARPIAVLDQVTDPHNVGAIMRSAAALGAAAIVTQDRHAPPEGGVVGKAASGALEVLPWVRVVNLGQWRWFWVPKAPGCATTLRPIATPWRGCRSARPSKASMSPMPRRSRSMQWRRASSSPNL